MIGVADELVEHALLVLDALDHHREILVEQATVPWAPSSSVSVVKLRMSENRTVARVLAPPSTSASPLLSSILRRNRRVHVARHCGLHALLGADVLDHEHRAELLAVTARQAAAL